MHLVLLETSSNQRYIFATNKLRENVGASELTYRVGTYHVLEAVKAITGVPWNTRDVRILRSQILSDATNPPLERSRYGVEVVLATSGKALLLVREKDMGQQIIQQVTEATVRLTPGLTVHGAISPLHSITDIAAVHQGIGEVHAALERARYQLPSTLQRLPRRPFVAECATSGLPAARYDAREPEAGARSGVALAKRRAAYNGYHRMINVVHQAAPDVHLPQNIADLDARFAGLEWWAVIHADGNGLGQLLLNFQERLQQVNAQATGRDYLNDYRHFSLALDVCTVEAFGTALRHLQERQQDSTQDVPVVPVVPLVLGGDDLTVICDGRAAVRFAHDFLTAFEHETTQDDAKHLDGIIPRIAQGLGAPRLSSCAGVAIVKPHFPFHAAYELAEDLLQSAKQVKTRVTERFQMPCSALDYHVLYDASGADLERLRGQLQVDGGTTTLVGRPYVVTPATALGVAQDDAWVAPRLWSQLQQRVEAMRPPASEDADQQRRLPNSMLHALREGLFLGQQQADARMQLVKQRYKASRFGILLARKSPPSLFWPEPASDTGGSATHHTTGFLDALDLVEFWR